MNISKNKPNSLVYVCTLSLLVNSFSIAQAASSLNRSKVRHYKSVNEVSYKDAKILAFKNKDFSQVIFKKENSTLSISRNNKKTLITFFRKANGKTHFIVLKKLENTPYQKIGYYSKLGQKYFLTKATSEPKLCTVFEEGLSKEYTTELYDKVQSFNISSMMDKDTCKSASPESLENFEMALKMGLDPSSAPLLRCLGTDEKIRKTLMENNRDFTYAATTFSTYLDVINGFADQNNPIKIKCSVTPEKNKISSIDTSKKPLELSVDIENLKGMESVAKEIVKSKVNLSIMHEFTHLGDNSIPTTNPIDDIKKNEAEVEYISCLCWNYHGTRESKPEKCEKPDSEIVKIGKGDFGSTIEAIHTIDLDTQAQQARVEQIKTDNKVSEHLAQNTKPLTLTPADSNAIEELANATFQTPSGTNVASLGEGKTSDVFLSEPIAKSLETIYDSSSKTINNFQAALQASIPAAQAASTSTLASTSRAAAVTNSRSIASVTTAPDSSGVTMSVLSREEIKAEQDSPTFMNVTDTPAGAAKLAAAAAKGNSFAGGATDAVQKNATGSSAGSTGGLGGAGSGSVISASANKQAAATTAAATTSLASADENTEPEQESTNEQPAEQSPTAIAATRGPASINPAVVDNTTLQKLSVFTEIKGTEYQTIQKNYNVKSFSDQLAGRHISIQAKVNGKIVILGDTTKPQIKFVDTGKGLIKINK